MYRDLKNSVQAFTVAELIVVALLSVLTISMAFFALNILDAQFLEYERESSKVLDISDLNSLINRDVLLAKHLELTGGKQLVLHFDSMKINYEIAEYQILRKATIAGAKPNKFEVEVTGFTASLNGGVVNSGLVDFVSIDLLEEEEVVELRYSKEYAAADFYLFGDN